MGVTRRAARFAFAALLFGAGAAAVAARPQAGTRELQIVNGDPRLDVAWALSEGGMSAADAQRVAVLLIDGVDPDGEGIAMSGSRGAEIWWREVAMDGTVSLRLMRTRVDFHWSNALASSARATVCGESESAFIAMRTTELSPRPIPPGSVVLVRVRDVWLTPGSDQVPSSAFAPLYGAKFIAECQPLVIDANSGVSTPTHWPTVQ